MKRTAFILTFSVFIIGIAGTFMAVIGRTLSKPNEPSVITVSYPPKGAIFPPEFTSPTFIWRDPSEATLWRIDITFADGSPAIHLQSKGEAPKVGEIDERCISSTNELPKLTSEESASHTWVPDEATWAQIKKHSVAAPATILFSGVSAAESVISQGQIEVQTSKDPVGAPIFYRDVPLMPSKTETGVIKPLDANAIPLIKWRLRNLGEPSSHVVLENMHTCANCHSFSNDGKTMGMDMDGPQNDKGLYAIVPIKPQTVIRNQDMVSWNPSQELQYKLNRVAFMSQLSPNGQYVITTVTGTDHAQNNYYVANFTDYRFLQVFYPTRGVLAWYSRGTGERHLLPGADDPRYVHTDAVWSPDGKYLVFARATAKDPSPVDGRMATYSNDPREVQVQYDLYRIPFNGGKGGQAERIDGASDNGMSNTFPKISPDGRWIIFVKNRNGQLMRPDSELFIVPFKGGEARRLRSNTKLMNSWHSFSPNGRWLVFSSKARSPYTQMYLTHIDENGNDSPAILIENSTAANRAVNLPEFVNIAPNGLLNISTPAVDLYRKFDQAAVDGEAGNAAVAIAEWDELAKTDPSDARIQNNFGAALARAGRFDEAIPHYQRGLELNPEYYAIHNNLGRALAATGRLADAIDQFEEGLRVNPNSAELHHNLGRAFALEGQTKSAVQHFELALQIDPQFAEAYVDLGSALLSAGRLPEAIEQFSRAVKINPRSADAQCYLGTALYYGMGDVPEALSHWHSALESNPNHVLTLSQSAHALAASPLAEYRNGAEAVRLAEQAVKLSNGQEPVYLDTLAMAYAESGMFTEAVDTALRAQQLATQQNQLSLATEINQRIELYRSNRTYRDEFQEKP